MDEAGTCHVGAGHIRQQLQPLGDQRRQLLGVLARGLGQHHGGIGGHIAVAGLARRFSRDAREVEARRQ